MRRLLRRLAWRNLPIWGKVGLLFLLQLALIALMSLTGFIALGTVQAQTEETVGTSLEMRAVAQELRIDLNALQRLEQRTTSDIGQPSGELDLATAQAQHAELATRLGASASRLQVLATDLPPSQARSQVDEQTALLASVLQRSEAQYGETIRLVGELATPGVGALDMLELRSNTFQLLAANSGDGELIRLAVTMLDAEQDYLLTQNNLHLEILLNQAGRFSARLQPASPQLEAALGDYLAELEQVANLFNQVSAAQDQSELLLNDMQDMADRLNSLTSALAENSLVEIEATNRSANTLLLGGVIGAAVVGAILTALAGRGFTRSVGNLIATTAQVEAGNLGVRAPVQGEDEFNQLAQSFNAMAVQLEGLVGGLEQRIAERTRDLSIVAEIGHSVVALRDPRDLMNEVVEKIRESFGFYHAQVFLIDSRGINAELIASTGAAGRELLARRHHLPVGSRSVIGQVAAYGEPTIALDTDTSAIHHRNEFLPETRSEIALPMRIGNQIIGALDIQSKVSSAFGEDDIAVFQLMADLLAIGLENARLYARYKTALEEVEVLSHQQIAQDWLDYRTERPDGPLGFWLTREGAVEAHGDQLPAPLDEAIRQGRLITVQGDGGEGISVAVPIQVRGEVIGALGLGGETLSDLSADDLALIQAVTERVGLALENRRLFEQTQRQARREQIVNEITAKIVGSTDVNYILKTTVHELGKVLRAPQTSVQLRGEGVMSDE